MSRRLPSSWQVILADLALILFLASLAGFTASRERHPIRPQEPFIAQAQALFRDTVGQEDTGAEHRDEFGNWLEMQAPDPRSQLTIFARYAPGMRAKIWQRANQFADRADQAGWQVRIILQPDASSAIHAAVAFDDLSQALHDPAL